MTAVDHAELKRLADWCRTLVNPDGAVVTRAMMVETLDQAADGLDAILSEIEGLKAERDGNWDEFLAERKSRMEHGAREAGYLDTISRLEARADEAERQLAALRTQAPDSWRPDREAINAAIEDADKRLAYGMELIKLVDGDHTYRLQIDGQTLFFTDSETEEWNAQDRLYEHIREVKNRIRADAVIAALRPQTAESGK